MSDFMPVVFKIDSEEYGIDINLVSAIEREQKIVRVPNASNNIKGIINLRGEVIPVYDLRKKFKLQTTGNVEETCLIIVVLPTVKIALEVDSVEEIHNIQEANIVTMPSIFSGIETECFKNVVNLDGRLILIIDVSKLLTADETKKIEQLIDGTN